MKLESSVNQLEFDSVQVHSDLQSKVRQLSDLASTANDLRQELSRVHDQLTATEKEVSLLHFTIHLSPHEQF